MISNADSIWAYHMLAGKSTYNRSCWYVIRLVSSCINNCQQTCGQHGMYYCSSACCLYAIYGERHTSKTYRVHQLTALLALDGQLSRTCTPILQTTVVQKYLDGTKLLTMQVQKCFACKYNERCKIIQQITYTIVGISTTVQYTDNLQYASRHIMQHHVRQ